MSYPKELKQLKEIVSSQLPELSQPQARVAAEYSYGMMMLRTCGQTQIATFLGLLLDEKVESVRQRLKEWNYERKAKRGQKRREVVVREQFKWLLKWILKNWTGKNLVLAMDASNLVSRFTVLSISVVYEGTAIPVAWKILKGEQKGKWNPIWKELLNALAEFMPKDLTVYVLTDRGISCRDLFECIVAHRWHPVMRVSHQQAGYRHLNKKRWHWIRDLCHKDMDVWCQRVILYKTYSMPCTLMVSWEAPYDDPCYIMTDLPPQQIYPKLYAFRAWIEQGFKDIKRGGFHWEQSKIPCPQRAERLWLIMAITLICLIQTSEAIPFIFQNISLSMRSRLSPLTKGFILMLVYSLRQRPIPRFSFRPYEQGIFTRQLKTYP